MPTYEYACKSCGQHLEVVQSFRDDPLAACPHCGGSLRKVFGTIGIAFKGSGFYKTDSRSTNGQKDLNKAGSQDSSTKSEKADKSNTASSGSKSAGASDSPTAKTA